MDDSEALLSDEDDPELLLFVPFTVQVRLRAFTLIGGSELTTPIKCKMYVLLHFYRAQTHTQASNHNRVDM